MVLTSFMDDLRTTLNRSQAILSELEPRLLARDNLNSMVSSIDKILDRSTDIAFAFKFEGSQFVVRNRLSIIFKSIFFNEWFIFSEVINRDRKY